MAGTTLHPLTAQEAKTRLREAAANAGVSGWVRRHPYISVGTALAAGYTLGSCDEARAQAGSALIRLLLRSTR